MVRFAATIAFLCVSCAAVPSFGQSRGAGLAHAPAVHTRSRPGTVGTPLNPNFGPIRGGAPGLGYDYQHLAAVGGRSRGIARNGRRPQYVVPIFDSYLPLSYPYGDYQSTDDTSLEPQPFSGASVSPDQQQDAEMPPPLVRQPRSAYQANRPPQPAPLEPALPDIGQFTIVRRDGQVLMAAAFTIADGQVTYITTEGKRHSFPVAELNTEATRQVNDVDGTTVKLPK